MMNPLIWLLLLGVGSLLLLAGVLSAVLGWLPLAAGIALATLGGLIETAGVLGFVRARRGGGR
jgi:hypothetical protein